MGSVRSLFPAIRGYRVLTLTGFALIAAGVVTEFADSRERQITEKALEQRDSACGSLSTNWTLFDAMGRGSLAALRSALDRGDNPNCTASGAFNYKEAFHSQTETKYRGETTPDTALQFAVELGREDMVELLVARGAEIDQPCDGKTPLYLASAAGRPGMVKLLLRRGANPRAAMYDCCPLEAASRGASNQDSTAGDRRNYQEIADLLKQAGAPREQDLYPVDSLLYGPD